MTAASSRGSRHGDERPFGRDANRGIFVEGTEIVNRGIDEWSAEAIHEGPHAPRGGAETHHHPFIATVFAECDRNVERLAAEGNEALNIAAARADSAVSETIGAQANLRKAYDERDAAEKAERQAEQALSDLEASTGLSSGASERFAQWIPLAIGFALETVLLYLAFQTAEFGAAWIRWLVVVLIGAFMTFIAHSLASWITADWDREPGRRRLHIGIAVAYAVCVGGILVGLAYIRSQDIQFASRSLADPGLFTFAVLMVLFLVSVMGSIFAGYAGYRHGRTAPHRHARRTLVQSRAALKHSRADVERAENAERTASAAEETATGRLDSLVDVYARALSNVVALAKEVGSDCLRAENRGFTIEREYRAEVRKLETSTETLSAAVSLRHQEIRNDIDLRRQESYAHQT
jgi:ABC-type multidrug transport system fused ATPase/permease subunit